jgi:hypothetical protein
VDLSRIRLAALAGSALLGAGAATAIAASPPLLKARLITGSEFPGYERSRAVVIRTAAGWAKANPWITAHLLRQLGFVAGAYGDLRTIAVRRRAQTSLLSMVVQFGSAAGAAEYAFTFLRVQPSQGKRFAVHGIPEAYGVALPHGYEIWFVDGPFEYELTAFAADRSLPPSEPQTVRAAARWYARVHRRRAP